VTYFSTELNRYRRMHVYTPPGYGLKQQRYPVLYLLHGAMDSDDSWGTVGRAGFILDNLIADGRASPMIVVMPHGHAGPFSMGGGARSLPLEQFASEFTRDIRPYIEANYPRHRRALDGRWTNPRDRAPEVAGLCLHRRLQFRRLFAGG
jgi:enterochelin esterase family protein